MQRLLLLGFLCRLGCVCASAEVLTEGLSVTTASGAMQQAGYAKTGLDMAPPSGQDLRVWEVGQGVLIVRASRVSWRIVGLTFSVADERPKALRKEFYFDVASFDTRTGAMTIRTRKGEQGGKADGSQPVRSERIGTASAAASRR